RRPDVQEDDLALVVGDGLGDRRAVDRRCAEVRCLRPDSDGEQLVVEDSRRGEQPTAQEEHDESDECPLLPNGHTLTPHLPRSSPISWTGSCAEKIALPATNVSA